MPKMKTRKSAAKRLKRTASGKLKRSKQGRRHLLSSKSTKRKRNLRSSGVVDGSDEKRVKHLIP